MLRLFILVILVTTNVARANELLITWNESSRLNLIEEVQGSLNSSSIIRNKDILLRLNGIQENTSDKVQLTSGFNVQIINDGEIKIIDRQRGVEGNVRAQIKRSIGKNSLQTIVVSESEMEKLYAEYLVEKSISLLDGLEPSDDHNISEVDSTPEVKKLECSSTGIELRCSHNFKINLRLMKNQKV